MNFRLNSSLAKDNFPKLGGDVSNDSKAIISLRTGKCTLNEISPGKYNVTPIKNGRGNLILVKGNDGKHHLQWFNLTTKALIPEIDHIVYNGVATMKKVKIVREDADSEVSSSADKDRVIVVRLTKEIKQEEKDEKSTEYIMFWVQDKAKSNVDIDNIINTFNNTVKSVSNTTRTETSAAPALDFSALLSQLKSDTSATATNGENKVLTVEKFQNAFQGLNRTEQFSLNDVLSYENIISSGILEDEEVVKELKEQLPPQLKDNANEIAETLRSPQLQQAIGGLQDALTRTSYSSIATNLGLPLEPAQNQVNEGNNIGAFITSIEALSKSEVKDKSSEEKTESNEDKMEE